MDQNTKRLVIEILNTKSFDNPDGIFAPNLTALMGNLRFAIDYDVKPVFLENLHETLEEAETICARVRCVLSLLEDPRNIT